MIKPACIISNDGVNDKYDIIKPSVCVKAA